jgi:hypothetical protein
MVLGVAAIPAAAAGATPSTGRLMSIANDLGFPGRIEHQTVIGNGRCRPACSELRRDAFVEDSSFASVRGLTLGVLREHRYTFEEYPEQVGGPVRIDASKGKVMISLEITFVSLARTRVAEIFIAKGPAPHHSVG